MILFVGARKSVNLGFILSNFEIFCSVGVYVTVMLKHLFPKQPQARFLLWLADPDKDAYSRTLPPLYTEPQSNITVPIPNSHATATLYGNLARTLAKRNRLKEPFQIIQAPISGDERFLVRVVYRAQALHQLPARNSKPQTFSPFFPKGRASGTLKQGASLNSQP